MLTIAQMKKANASKNPRIVTATDVASGPASTKEQIAATLGAAIPAARVHTARAIDSAKSFMDMVRTSYVYHDNLRKQS